LADAGLKKGMVEATWKSIDMRRMRLVVESVTRFDSEEPKSNTYLSGRYYGIFLILYGEGGRTRIQDPRPDSLK